MNKKKYYAVTQTTSFTKTVYVPVECADDIKGAVDLVADSCDVSSPVDLCDNWDEFGVEVEASPYADADGSLTDGRAHIGSRVRELLVSLERFKKDDYDFAD